MANISLRERLLDALPAFLAVPLYRLRNHDHQMRAEVLANVWLDLVIPSRSRLWRQRLSTHAGHEPALCAWLQQHLRPDEVFVDVGAAFGFFPALVQAVRPNAEIHALEAGWKQMLYLQANQRLHGNRWHVRQGYMGSKDSENTLRLDTYAAKMTRRPTLVKMDVDGAEYDILRGASSLIAARQTEFLVEIHPHELPKFGATTQQVLDLFADRYRILVLPNLRESGEAAVTQAQWSDDLRWLERDPNPYLYLAPEEIARF